MNFATTTHTTVKPARLRFMRHAATALAAGCLIAISGHMAQAAKVSTLKIGSWNGGAYTNNQTGDFSHCVASARYKSGTNLLFSVTKSGRWTMGMANNTWNLARNTRYNVQFQVDRGQILKGRAIAKSKALVQIFLPTNSKLFRHFRYGKQLKVKAAKQLFRFNLTDTEHMLKRLVQCAAHHRKKGTENPFASGDGNPFANDDGNSNPFQPAGTSRSLE